MWVALGIIVAAILVAMYACLWVAGEESRREEDE